MPSEPLAVELYVEYINIVYTSSRTFLDREITFQQIFPNFSLKCFLNLEYT